jgi:hypothetical protein
LFITKQQGKNNRDGFWQSRLFFEGRGLVTVADFTPSYRGFNSPRVQPQNQAASAAFRSVFRIHFDRSIPSDLEARSMASNSVSLSISLAIKLRARPLGRGGLPILGFRCDDLSAIKVPVRP